jgi:hypothetical protein
MQVQWLSFRKGEKKMLKKIDGLVIRAQIKIGQAFAKNEDTEQVGLKAHRGVDGVVVAAVLIVIGVGVGILFRNQIMAQIDKTLTTMGTKMDSLFNGTTGAVS